MAPPLGGPQTPPVSSQASPSQPHLQQPPKLGYSRPGPGWVASRSLLHRLGEGGTVSSLCVSYEKHLVLNPRHALQRGTVIFACPRELAGPSAGACPGSQGLMFSRLSLCCKLVRQGLVALVGPRDGRLSMLLCPRCHQGFLIGPFPN